MSDSEESSAKKPFSATHWMEVRLNGNLRDNPKMTEGLDCVFQFEIGDKIWNLDLISSSKPQIKKGPHDEPDCTISMSDESFEGLIKGKINIAWALLRGKIKIKGDKSLALKLGKLFG